MALGWSSVEISPSSIPGERDAAAWHLSVSRATAMLVLGAGATAAYDFPTAALRILALDQLQSWS